VYFFNIYTLVRVFASFDITCIELYGLSHCYSPNALTLATSHSLRRQTTDGASVIALLALLVQNTV